MKATHLPEGTPDPPLAKHALRGMGALSQCLQIAVAEWRHWSRSRLAVSAAAVLLVLLLSTIALTTMRVQAELIERLHHQTQSETAFLSQPDRHPHRMVHYGHYVFRTPAPLAALDPGLDAITGQALFLEGHRQNTAMFAAATASAQLGALSSLNPAMVYQLLAPLLLILFGHSVLAREREAGTLSALLAQGLKPAHLIAGKAVALGSVVLLLLLPLAVGAAWAVGQGESLGAAAALVLVYLLYLAIWAGLSLLASAFFQQRATALTVLTALWIGLTLVLPALAASAAASLAPSVGKLESELAMLTDVRELSDGHNANDPAFAQLRADLLVKHGVQRVEDLPVNLRGVVAQVSERQLTEMLNRYAQRQMGTELRQDALLARQAWVAPVLALSDASRAVAGTDLLHHHRFLREAEAVRYAFVQGLNQVHAEQLAYADDIRRSSDAEAERRTRVTASNWALLDRFRLEPAPARDRVAQAASSLGQLLVWCCLLLVALAWAGRRLTP